MKWSEWRFSWLMLIVLAFITGCNALAAPGDTTPAVQPVSSQAISEERFATLTTLETTVRRLRGGSDVEVSKNEAVDIVPNDQIALEEQGHGLLRFEDALVVELFRDTEVEVSDARLETDGPLLLGLKQIAGSTRTELNARRDARLKIETELATAEVTSATGEDAELVICHAPQKVTCLVTVKGAVEVAAVDGSRRVTVHEGEATYVWADQPLSDPICVVQEEFQAWLARERNGEENRPLGAIVKDWPQQGCNAVVEATPAPTAVPLPSGTGMLRVQGGLYEVGVGQPDEYHVALRQIEVPPFWIDAYEVTNSAYQLFINDTGHSAPTEWPYAGGRESHPVKGVSWNDAADYCASVNKRLPTEAEWEVAGRGDGSPPRLYPWGDDPFAGGQMDQLSPLDTHAVGSADFNASPSGVYDLVGNVWEWVGEPYAPTQEGVEILRGGRHGFPRDLAYRQPAGPADPNFLPFAGFRCAADQVEGE